MLVVQGQQVGFRLLQVQVPGFGFGEVGKLFAQRLVCLRVVGQVFEFGVQPFQLCQVLLGVGARGESGVNVLQRLQERGAMVAGARGLVEAGLRRGKLLRERLALFDVLFQPLRRQA